MFGTRLTQIEPIKKAVATYTQRAAEKLRAQNSLCKRIRVSIRTGMFNPEEAKYANGPLVELPYPTNDVRLMTKAATEAVTRTGNICGCFHASLKLTTSTANSC